MGGGGRDGGGGEERKGAFNRNKDGTSRPLAARLHIAQTGPSWAFFRQMNPVISSVKPFSSRLSDPASGHHPITRRHANHLFRSPNPRRPPRLLWPPRPRLFPPHHNPSLLRSRPSSCQGRGQCWVPHAYADNLPPPSRFSCTPRPLFPRPKPPPSAGASCGFPAASARLDVQSSELWSGAAVSRKEACARSWNRRGKGRKVLSLKSSRRSSLRLAEQGRKASKMPQQVCRTVLRAE